MRKLHKHLLLLTTLLSLGSCTILQNTQKGVSTDIEEVVSIRPVDTTLVMTLPINKEVCYMSEAPILPSIDETDS